MLYAGIAALVAVFWAIITYNRFVSLRRKAGEAWSGIAVQLKRRHDLIPNLVETVKGYAAHETDLFTRVTEARAAMAKLATNAPSKELGKGEGEISGLVGKLFALAEAYPEIRANENFVRLHEALYDAEEQLQMARRYYNGAVREYMTLHESFPPLIIARLFSFKTEEFFELENEAERALPSVAFS